MFALTKLYPGDLGEIRLWKLLVQATVHPVLPRISLGLRLLVYASKR
jgi:hypothetical protein